MKKKFLLLFHFLSIFGLGALQVKGQECTGGGCNNLNKNYPTSTLPATSAWGIVNSTQGTAINGGNYAYYNVTGGYKYYWSTCSSFGGHTGFDALLTLFDCNGTQICYSNDVCDGTGPYLTWFAATSCTVKVLLSANGCQNNGPSGPYCTLVWMRSATICNAVTNGTTQPQNQTRNVGENATFNVSANGTPPFSYFWYKNGAFVQSTINNSSTTNSYSTPMLTAGDNGNTYYCLLQNCYNSYQVQSNMATLTVTNLCTAPTIANPGNVIVTAPNSATFYGNATGTQPYTWQWQSMPPGGSWSNLSNSGNITWTTQTISALTINNTTGLNNYQYRCIVTNQCNSATSSAGTLIVNSSCIAPGVSTPVDKTVTAPNPATFTSTATGTSAFTYQWQAMSPGGAWTNLNNSGNSTWSISGNSSTLTLGNSTGLNNYQYRCVVSNGCNPSAISNSAILTVSSAPQPSVISFYNKISNNLHFIFAQLLVSASINNIITPVKVCADGSQSTYIEYQNNNPSVNTSNIQFRIAEDINGGQPSVYGSFFGAYNLSSSIRKVYFNHPTYMDWAGKSRSTTIQVVDEANGNTILASYPMEIYRAPIVFAHGFLGNYQTFESLRNDVVSSNLYPPNLSSTKAINFTGSYNSGGVIVTCNNCIRYETVIFNPLMHLIDYSQTAGSSFSVNAYKNVIANAIDSVFKTAKANNYSCGKVILIGHSMGGVLSRLYLQSTYHDGVAQDYRFDIQKLITVNTPHYGTQFANFMLDPLNGGILSFLTLEGVLLLSKIDAINDLRVNSNATTQNLNIALANQNKVPSHTISTIVTSPSTVPEGQFDAMALKTLLCHNLFCKNIFNSESSDMVVPLSSQQGNLYWGSSDNNRFHIGSSRSNNVKSEITNLINSNPVSSDFSLAGFPPKTLHYNFFGMLLNPFDSNTGVDSVKILNFNSGQQFIAGDSINILFSNTNGINNVKAYLTGGFNTLFVGNTSVSNSSIKFKSDSGEVGRRWIYLLGYDSLNFRSLDSVAINFNNLIQLDSVKIFPKHVSLPLGYKQKLIVNGYYHDGIVRELRDVTGLNFAFDTTKIAVDGNYTIMSKTGPFNILLTANYQNRVDSVLVETSSDNNNNIVNLTCDKNKICKGSQINFTDASLGIVQSRSWQFPGGVPNSSSLSNPNITYTSPGIYRVTLITTFSNGTDTLSIDSLIEVVDNASPSITIFNTGDSVLLSSSSATGNQWYKDGAIIPAATNQNYSLAVGGSYKLQTRDVNGCLSNPSSEFLIPSIYTFTGNGNWDNAANWNSTVIPPSKLLIGSEVIINPAGLGECILYRRLTVTPGAQLTARQGKKITISTSASLPTITTSPASDVGVISAVSGGNIINDGGLPVTSRGLCYGLTPNPTFMNKIISEGTINGSFVSNLMELTSNSTYYVRAYAVNSVGTSYGNQVTFTTYGEVISPTGKIWLDRNLGASRVATSNTDYLAYGSLYQWGRSSDGHQLIDWTSSTTGTPVNGTTTVLSTSDVPGHSFFILGTTTLPYDWRTPQNNNLWQGIPQLNNACPTGYRVPTITELSAEFNFFPTQDAVGAFTSALKLPVSGLRNPNTGVISVSSFGSIWSSTTLGIYAQPLGFGVGGGTGSGRFNGMSIRCIKN